MVGGEGILLCDEAHGQENSPFWGDIYRHQNIDTGLPFSGASRTQGWRESSSASKLPSSAPRGRERGIVCRKDGEICPPMFRKREGKTCLVLEAIWADSGLHRASPPSGNGLVRCSPNNKKGHRNPVPFPKLAASAVRRQLAGAVIRRIAAVSCIARDTEVLTTSTRVPIGTDSKTLTTSRERMRMQPKLAGRPMSRSCGVPWM